MKLATARRSLGVCLLGLAVLASTSTIASASDPVYDEVGNQYGRGYFAPLPFERIDTVTGNVFLSFTDLVLPGNAGFNISVLRTYNSKDARWHFGIGQAPLYFVYNLPGGNLADIDFIAADGSKHNAAGSTATTTTQEFWQFTKSTYKLEMPNGLVATYGYALGTSGRYLTELRDPFDNVVTFQWEAGTDHLLGIERAADVVVGAVLERRHRIRGAGQHRDHDQRQRAARPERLDRVGGVDPGGRRVEEHQPVALGGRPEPTHRVGLPREAQPARRARAAQEQRQIGPIRDEEDGAGVGGRRRRHGRGRREGHGGGEGGHGCSIWSIRARL